MSHLRKHLFLLQLEEYQADRYNEWLHYYRIEDLQERKKQLVITPRIVLTAPLAFLLGVPAANWLVGFFFKIAGFLLTRLAAVKLRCYPRLTRIVITGSYGKTTFKEMLAWVLQDKYSVLSTPGSVNTGGGIASMVLKQALGSKQVLIVEAGAYKQGEIRDIGKMVRPDFGIITIIGWMHLGRFKTIDKIRSAKFELGELVDDKNNFFAPEKDHVMIDFEDIVTSIAVKMGITESRIRKRLASFSPPEHRLKIKQLNAKVTLVDDSYNSNPIGFTRALTELKKFKKEQKIIATPGMIDLGEKQFELNEAAAKEAAEVVDLFVIVGHTNKEALASGIKKAKRKIAVVYLTKDDELFFSLSPFLRPPSVLLVENDLPDNYF